MKTHAIVLSGLIALFASLSDVEASPRKKSQSHIGTIRSEIRTYRSKPGVATSRTSRSGAVQELSLSRKAAGRYESSAISGKSIRRFDSHIMEDVEVLEGTPKVVVEGRHADEAIAYLHFSVRNGTLTADMENLPDNYSFPKLKITVYLDEISNLSSYAGDIRAGDVTATALTLNTYGIGDINIGNVTSTSLKAMTYGTGDILIDEGVITTMQLVTQGTGDIRVKRAEFTSARLSSHGTGDILLEGFEGTQVSVASYGTGDVTLRGTASSADITIRGMGEVDTSALDAPIITKTVIKGRD